MRYLFLATCFTLALASLWLALQVGPILPLFYSTPLFFLFLVGIWKGNNYQLWATMVVLSLLVVFFHAFWLYDTNIRLPRDGGGGGANIGLGVLGIMLPFIAFMSSIATWRFFDRKI